MRIQTILILLLTSVSLTGQGIMLAGGAVAEEPGFNPTSIPDCYAWWSATDIDGDDIENEEVSAPTTWVDKTGNGYNLTKTGSTAPTLSLSKINGQNVVEFYGGGTGNYVASTASDWTFLHNGDLSTVFIVAEAGKGNTNPNDIYGFYSTFGFTSAQTGLGLALDDRSSLSRNNAILYSSGKSSPGNPAISDLQNNIITAGAFRYMMINTDADNSIASNRSSYRIDGVAVSGANSSLNSPSSNAPTQPFTLGGVNGSTTAALNGYIAEVIIYSRYLSSEEIGQVETYLKNKYGL